MKTSKILAAVVLSVGLYSCGCEDVNLGELKQTKELTTYLPAYQVDGKSFIINYQNTSQPLHYRELGTVTSMKIPVAETGKTKLSGKFISYDCIEYYTAEKQEYKADIGIEHPVDIRVKYTKDVNEHGLNNITDKEQVVDVIEFTAGLYNKFPTTVTRDRYEYNNFTSYRSFILAKDPSKLLYKPNDITQKFLTTVTLNGIQHHNVYFLYLNSPQQTEDEQYFNKSHPLDYIQGIYVKEGIGIIQAYTFKGEQIAITVE